MRTVEELLDIGLYSIMCVKQGCAGYPRDAMKAQLRQRGDTVFYETTTVFNRREREEFQKVFAAGHMDKQPLLLCASTGTSLRGESEVRYRSRIVNGEYDRKKYTLEQPQVHATYRKYAPAVD